MNTLPKSKCPPAKPPRRKLSYSSESGKGTSDSSLIHPVTETDKINETKKHTDNAVNHKLPGNLTDITRNKNLSKSSSSASSGSKESGGSPFTDIGSDYGSFQGDQFNLPSDCNMDYLTHQWSKMPSKSMLRTPQKTLFNNFPTDTSTSHLHCCSSSTPIKSPHCLMPHSTPSNAKNNSVYYTPPCNTPCSKKYPNEESSVSNDSFICNLPSKPVCCGVERRHNSDPQISLERRPSRRFKNGGKTSLLSRSKRTCVEDSSRRKKRSQSFVCNQHHHHHQYHHRETEVNKTPHVIVFPHPSLCCLDSWRKTKLDSCSNSLEDICQRIWNKHQNQSQNSKHDWLGAKATSSAGNFPELLSEIYYAQKERDKASQERLEMIIEQRNKLMAEVESLKQIIFRQNVWRNESNDDESDCDTIGLDQILKSLDETYSPTKLEFHKNEILAKINRANRERRTKLSSLHSRRGSSQPQSLMDELNNPAEIWNCDGFVCQKVSEERSKAMAAMQKMTEMEDDLTSLKLYSLQNHSLNGHGSSKSQDKMPKLHSDEDEDDEEEEIGVFHIDSVNSSVDEELRVKLQKEIKARHEAEDNCRKLERLVNVLRKKIAGVSIGVQV